MLLPFIMDCEAVGQYVHRVAALSGRLGTVKTWSQILGRPGVISVAFPTSLDRLSEALGIEDKEYLIREHSSAPTCKPFLLRPVYEEMVRRMRNQGVRGALLAGDKNKQVARYCTECAKSDIQLYGFPYFRTQHCLAGVFVCPLHHCVLTTGCCTCRWSSGKSSRVFLPSEACMCGKPALPCITGCSTSDLEFAENIAGVIVKIGTNLSDSWATREAVGHAYCARFAALGISNSTHFKDFVLAKSSERIAELFHLPLTPISGLLRTIRHGEPPPASVAWNGLLMASLFGTIDEASAAVRAAPRVASEERVIHCRHSLTQFMALNPKSRFPEMFSELQSECEYLRQFDPGWIRTFMYAIGSPRVQWRATPQSPRKPTHENDQEMLTHMTKRLDLLLSEQNHPRKITMHNLLWGHPMSQVSKEDLKKFPLSSAFADREIESSERFHFRVLKYLVANHSSFPPGTWKGRQISSLSRSLRVKLDQDVPEKGKEPFEIIRRINRRRAHQQNAKRKPQ